MADGWCSGLLTHRQQGGEVRDGFRLAVRPFGRFRPAASLLNPPSASFDQPILSRIGPDLGGTWHFPHVMSGTAIDVACDCSILAFNALKSCPFLMGPLASVHAIDGSPRSEAPQELLKGQG